MPQAIPPTDALDSRLRAALDAHWRRNLRLLAALLAIWAFAGLGCGVLWVEWLNLGMPRWCFGIGPQGSARSGCCSTSR